MRFLEDVRTENERGDFHTARPRRSGFAAECLVLTLVLSAAFVPIAASGQDKAPGETAPSPEPAAFGSLAKSLIVPGWGQIAEKRYAKGVIFLSAEVLCLAGFLSYNHTANEHYERYRNAVTREDAVTYRALTEKYDARRNRVLLAAAAVWIVNLIDIASIVKSHEKKQGTLRLGLECGPRPGLAVTLTYRR